MKRAWIILGEANTKKSSVIRTLTGLPKINDGGIPGFVQIEQTNGLRFSLLSYISAMQEAKISPEELLKKIELSNTRQLRKLKNTTDPTKEHRKKLLPNRLVFKNARNILVPLRFNQTNINKKNYPDGRIYIEKLLNNNWEIEAAISLGQWSPKWLVESGLRYASIPWSNKSQHTNTEEKQSESLSNVGYDNAPGSVVAARVRKFFEWV